MDEAKELVLPEAFLPRQNGRDDDGLSVHATSSDDLSKECQECVKPFSRVYSIGLLIAHFVREVDTKLDAVADPLEGLPNHALITGVPNPQYDPSRAERLAGQLARICKLIPFTK